MNEDRIQELLLQLVQDMSFVKAKLSNIEEQKLVSRVDALEAQNREHDRVIKSLENRSNTMEQFTRQNIQDSKKQMVSVYVSMGIALLSAVLSFVFKIF